MKFFVGETIMVNDPMAPKKVPAEIIEVKEGAEGRMYLIKSEWGESWRREDVLAESARRLINQ